MKRVSPNERTVAINLPPVMQQALGKSFSHRDAAKDNNAAAEKSTIAPKIDPGDPSQLRAIEQDRLRRQEFEPCACLDVEPLIDRRRRARRAIDLLGRRTGSMCRR